MRQSPMSGGKLILLSIACAVAPFVIELIADGGPGNFGKAETGWAALMSGFFLWPLGLILFLIGIKRAIFNDGKSSIGTQNHYPDIPPTPAVATWNMNATDTNSAPTVPDVHLPQ